MTAPLLVLCVLSIGSGWLGFAWLSDLFGDGGVVAALHVEPIAIATVVVPLLGIGVGWFLFRPSNATAHLEPENKGIRRFLFEGWGFDWMYDRMMVRPFVRLAQLAKSDLVDRVFDLIATIARVLHNAATISQNGRLRWYVWNVGVGLVVVILLVRLA